MLFCIGLRAQSSYTCRYWFDQDDGQALTTNFSDSPWHVELDVGQLTDGIHTLHMQVMDTSMLWGLPKSCLFTKTSEVGAEGMIYHCWFDNENSCQQSNPLGDGHLVFDVSTLTTGVHTLHVMVKGSQYASPKSFLFLKTDPYEQDSTGIGRHFVYHCWFDEDFSTVQSDSIGDGHIFLDVADLNEGLHTMNIMLEADHLTSAKSYLFIKDIVYGSDTTGMGGVLTYQFWIDQDYSTLQTGLFGDGNFLLDVTDLELGEHTLHVMLEGNDLTAAKTFEFTKRELSPCPYPENLMADVNVGSVLLSWTCESDNYRLRYYSSDSPDPIVVDVEDNTYEILNPELGTYYWEAQSICTEVDTGFFVAGPSFLVPHTYTIAAYANPGEGGTVAGAGEYLEGSQATLSAMPNYGFGFMRWTENNQQVSNDSEYSFQVTGNRQLVAHFSRLDPLLAVTPSSINFGEVILSQSESDTLNVNGDYLVESLNIQIVGEDAPMFSFATPEGWDDYSGGELILTFTPTTARWEYHATLVVSTGILTRTIPLTGYLADTFVFNTYVDEEIYPMNAPIPIHGSVADLESAPVANMEVEIGITVMDWKRTLTVVTDGNGQFSTVFEPMPLESGYYTVNSGLVGSNNTEVHDGFNILGMTVVESTLNEGMQVVNSNWILCDVVQDVPKTGYIMVRNKNSFELTNVQVTVLSAPEGSSFTFEPMNLAGLQEGYLEYSALGTIPTQGYEYQEVRLKATCDQGAEAMFTIWFYCGDAQGILNVSPTALDATMTRGESKTIDVTLTNNGMGATGEITVSLPNVEWMSVVGGNTLSSIAVGESATFTLRFSPRFDLPLGPYSGSIAINCEHGEWVDLPFTITAVSDSCGSLIVDVTDEFSTNTNEGNGPHVEGAEVTLISYYALDTVAHGYTDADGTFSVDCISEGYYNLNVEEEGHSPCVGIIYIFGGRPNTEGVFMPCKGVSYSWVVVPAEIEDKYHIELNIEVRVDVPAPVVTIEAPQEIPAFEDSYTFDYVITNHGLIDAHNLTLYTPENEDFKFTALYNHIDTLYANSYVTIPCEVIRKSDSPSGCGEWMQSYVRYGYRSGPRWMYNQAFTYSLVGGSDSCNDELPPLVGGGGSGGGGAPSGLGFGYGNEWATSGYGVPTHQEPMGNYGHGNHSSPHVVNQLPSVDVRVGVQFSNTLTMTREAFKGTFEVHNDHATKALTDIGLDFVIKDENGRDRTDWFQISVETMINVTGIDGDGTLAANSRGMVKIQFIPKRQAAPREPVDYYFGGTFTFVDPNTLGVTRTMNLYPTKLTVHPSPDLHIDYFIAKDFYGDNPLTPNTVEESIPAELAVRIWNKGAGTARKVKLDSSEPVIVSNAQGLLIDFGLYGTYMQGVGVQLGLKYIDFGDIESNQTKVGEWLFTSSLLAHVASYSAHLVHDGIYGKKLSLVSHVAMHSLARPIYAQSTRTDGIHDFLVDDVPDENNYPDSIYFSNGGKTSVGVVESASFDKFVTSHDTIVTLTVNPSRIGWNYGEIEDPGRNRYELVNCIRNNDNQDIPLSNIWQEAMLVPNSGDSLYANKLRFVDTLSVIQPVTYTLVFAGNPSDLYIFFGDEDEYWSNADNWEGNAKPQNASNNVLVDGICLLDEDATVASMTISEGKSLTIPECRILTVSNNLENTISTGLVIEEGGQLIHGNAGVQATVEKSVTPYTPGTKDGWHLVASSLVDNVCVDAVQNLLSNNYDLYYYDEPTVYWINQEDATNNFTELENGKGYLYGNNEEVTLEFAGELQNGSAMVEVSLSYTSGSRLAGFNLVGNPYAHNVTSYTSENVVNGCFVMNEAKDDLVVSEINEDNPLKPAEGFFVKATEEDASITFNPQSVDKTSPNGSIRVELAENDKLVDRLIVKTAEGQSLEKFSLNDMRTKLFAQGDSQELAIVPCQGNEQPISFKASSNGQYTVAVNTDGMKFKYLHLVDNITGEDVDLLVDSTYTFEARTSDYASRFLLRFILSEGDASEQGSFVYFFKDKMVIANEGKATLQVIDLLGHILSSEQINGNCEKQITAAPGVYMIRLINGDDMKVQKVVVR